MGVKADPRLLEAMQARATATARDFIPQNVANFIWALATMGVKADPRLLEAMQARATATARDFKTQEVANFIWGLACFDISRSQVASLMVESMAGRLLSLRAQLSVGEKSQVHQWLLFCDLHPEWHGQLPTSMQKVKEEHGGDFRQAFALEAPTTSRLQVGEHLFSAPLCVGLAMCLHGAEPRLFECAGRRGEAATAVVPDVEG
jgi:hypothetical protein